MIKQYYECKNQTRLWSENNHVPTDGWRHVFGYDSMHKPMFLHMAEAKKVSTSDWTAALSLLMADSVSLWFRIGWKANICWSNCSMKVSHLFVSFKQLQLCPRASQTFGNALVSPSSQSPGRPWTHLINSSTSSWHSAFSLSKKQLTHATICPSIQSNFHHPTGGRNYWWCFWLAATSKIRWLTADADRLTVKLQRGEVTASVCLGCRYKKSPPSNFSGTKIFEWIMYDLLHCTWTEEGIHKHCQVLVSTMMLHQQLYVIL